MGAVGDLAIDLVAGLHRRHGLPYRLDHPGHVTAQDGISRTQDAGDGSHHQRRTREPEPVADADRRRMHAHEHLVRLERWTLDVSKLEHVRVPEAVSDDGLHHCLLLCSCPWCTL